MWIQRPMLTAAAAALVLAFADAAPMRAAPGVVFQTAVAPQLEEDIRAPCGYELTLLDPARPVRGVWIIFDRGRDMLRYYGDPDVQAFALRHDLALMVAFHCEGKTTSGDLNVVPEKGLGRTLFAALDQFATVAEHGELSSAGIIVMGFSGTGVLAARLPGFAPDRVRAAIIGGAGHDDAVGLNTIALSAKAMTIPQMIVAGGSDSVSGTERPYDYFRRHFDQGALWLYVGLNGTPHCCVINAKSLVLDWLERLVFAPVTRSAGVYGFIQKKPSTVDNCAPRSNKPGFPGCRSTTDNWGGKNWDIAAAAVTRRATPPTGMLPAGWLPNQAVARKWRSLVTIPQQSITSLP